MNTLNMPGFTADNSLYYSGRKYTICQVRSPERSSSAIGPQLRKGGGGLNNKCDDDYGSCYIGCYVDHPESDDSPNNLNSLFRDACLDSCDAAHRLCTPTRVATPIRAPIVGGVGTLAP